MSKLSHDPKVRWFGHFANIRVNLQIPSDSSSNNHRQACICSEFCEEQVWMWISEYVSRTVNICQTDKLVEIVVQASPQIPSHLTEKLTKMITSNGSAISLVRARQTCFHRPHIRICYITGLGLLVYTHLMWMCTCKPTYATLPAFWLQIRLSSSKILFNYNSTISATNTQLLE